MYCNSCGAALTYNDGHCTSCGALAQEFKGKATDVPMVAPNVAEAGLRGLGGWLALFWIGVSLIKPLLTLGELMTATKPIEQMIAVGMLALCGATTYLLWDENPRAIPMVRLYLIVELVFAAVFLFGAWSERHLYGHELWSPGSSMIRGIRFALYSIGWWLYFHLSIRVRNTYGENL